MLSPGRHQSVPPPARPPFEVAPHLLGLLLESLGEALDLGVDLFVGRPRWLLAPRPRAARGRRARPARRPSRTSSMNACGSWPVACEVLLERRILVRQAGARDLRRAGASRRRRARRARSIGTRSAAASSTLSRTAICACNLCIISSRVRMSARSSSTVSNSLASSTHSSVSSGSTFCFASFTMTRNVDVFARELAEAFGQRRGELEDRAGPRAAQLVVELGDDHAGADAVQEVGGGEPLDRLAVDRAGDVDRRVRVVDERVFGVGEVGEPIAQARRPAGRRRRRRPLRTAARRAARRSRGGAPCGRTSTTASNSTSPSSWPAVISISGGAMTSTSCSRPRRRSTRAASRAAPARAAMSVPRRASSRCRGALPGRKPGTRTSRPAS